MILTELIELFCLVRLQSSLPQALGIALAVKNRATRTPVSKKETKHISAVFWLLNLGHPNGYASKSEGPTMDFAAPFGLSPFQSG